MPGIGNVTKLDAAKRKPGIKRPKAQKPEPAEKETRPEPVAALGDLDKDTETTISILLNNYYNNNISFSINNFSLGVKEATKALARKNGITLKEEIENALLSNLAVRGITLK